MAKNLVLCLGNDILADDAVGIKVAEHLQGNLPQDTDLEVCSVSGLYLLDYLAGYDYAVIVDAFTVKDPAPGKLQVFDMEASTKPPVGPSPHYISLSDALAVGKAMGLKLPDKVTVVGIEVVDPYTFGKELTPGVAAAVKPAAQKVLEVLNARGNGMRQSP